MIPKLIRKELEPLIELIPQAIMDKWNLTPESIMEDVMYIQDNYFKDAGFGDILVGEIPYYIQYGTYNKHDKVKEVVHPGQQTQEKDISTLQFQEFHYKTAETHIVGRLAYVQENMLLSTASFTVRVMLPVGNKILVLPALSIEQVNQALRCSSIGELESKFLYKYE